MLTNISLILTSLKILVGLKFLGNLCLEYKHRNTVLFLSLFLCPVTTNSTAKSSASFLQGYGKTAFLPLPACRGVKGASYRQRLVPTHRSKCFQHPFPASLGRKGRLSADSVAKWLETLTVQGWSLTALSSTLSPPLFVDCCPVSKNGKTTWNPPLSTSVPARKMKERTGYNPQKVKNVVSVCVSIYISNIPRLFGPFLFHRRYQEQFMTFLCASLPEVAPTQHPANSPCKLQKANPQQWNAVY